MTFGRPLLLVVVKSESAAAATVGDDFVVPSFLEEKAAGILADPFASWIDVLCEVE